MNNQQLYEEEKYAGPRLQGPPEMVVSSGALGMTPTTRPRNVPWTGSMNRRSATETFYRNMGQQLPAPNPRIIRKRAAPSAPDMPDVTYTKVLNSKYTGPVFRQTTSSSAASSSSTPFATSPFPMTSRPSASKLPPLKKGNVQPINEPPRKSFFSALKKTIPIPIEEEPIVKSEVEVTPAPMTEEERLAKEKHEKELLRFKEIGRRICELDLVDFAPDKTKNDRKTFMIASRGEEILASVRRNLTIIQTKLGEYAEGTVFEDVDRLTDCFANATPNTMSRLTQVVAEKLRQRAEALEAEHLMKTQGHEGHEQQEEFQVKVEEPEYEYNC